MKIVEQEPEKPLRFAFLGFQNNPFWNLVQDGVAEATEFLAGHNVTIDNINLGENIDATVINNGLEAAVAQQYDRIVTTPFVTGVENYIDAAVDAGIPVVTLYGESENRASGSYSSDRTIRKRARRLRKQWTKPLGGEQGAKFAIITASFTMENLEIKRNTVKDYLESKGYVSVGDFGKRQRRPDLHAHEGHPDGKPGRQSDLLRGRRPLRCTEGNCGRR